MGNYKWDIIQLNVILIVVLKKSRCFFIFFLDNGIKVLDILDWGNDFMGEYIRGVVVKLHLTLEQEVLFKQNYGCTRKIRN